MHPKTIEIDVYYESSIQEILNLIEKHKGRIVNHLAHGPGGGNPTLHITFNRYNDAKAYVKELDPDNIHAYLP